MPTTSTTTLTLICDRCGKVKKVDAKTRDLTLEQARNAGWTFGRLNAATCGKCRLKAKT